MTHTCTQFYRNAGVLKKAGESLLFEIDSVAYYLMGSELAGLCGGQPALLVSGSGDEEGTAWLSPVRESRKIDLNLYVRGCIFTVRWREVQRIQNGQVHLARVMEYHNAPVLPPGKMVKSL